MDQRDRNGLIILGVLFTLRVLVPLCRMPWSRAWPIWLGFALGAAYFVVTWTFVLHPWLTEGNT